MDSDTTRQPMGSRHLSADISALDPGPAEVAWSRPWHPFGQPCISRRELPTRRLIERREP
jgi:hypothetical protein